ncbi:RNA-directed DNA polymerase [Candidatus Uhrbacteria bacterium]|nr:RNA-directed DNA polymerase [Candidatus Uhrbacteria bacterium]
MNVLDQFVKHTLKVKEYVRYTDDFFLVSSDRAALEQYILPIHTFLQERLFLTLHPHKIILRTFFQGIDFLGHVIFPGHRLIRTRTRRRMFRRLSQQIAEYRAGQRSRATLDAGLQSYLGVLSHANTYHVSQELHNLFWLLLTW